MISTCPTLSNGVVAYIGSLGHHNDPKMCLSHPIAVRHLFMTKIHATKKRLGWSSDTLAELDALNFRAFVESQLVAQLSKNNAYETLLRAHCMNDER